MVGIGGYEITPATSKDIAAILDLQERNLRANGGKLSVRFSREWFEKAIFDMPIIVACNEGQVVGYVVSTPLTAQAHDPIIQAMLRAYPGSPDAYNYGPICVAENHRGQGIAVAMFEQLKARLPGREGFTFIRQDNTSSITVHTRMGMRKVAEFTQGDTAYMVVAYTG
ncbi:MAG: GNAT family N-acetyltransferase [Hyphomicrobiales bacterium]|nr:GNAT family N-acetyltransferase [Hyphomicrobiales bacterium]